MVKILLNDLDVLTEFDKEEFSQLKFKKIEAVTKRGETDKGAALIDGRWIPKSQLRCDFDKNLYMANWLNI